MGSRLARSRAERLVEQLRIVDPPVDVRRIANEFGIRVIETDLGEEVSGILVTGGDTRVIFVRKRDPAYRKRLSIAHEFGHYYLGHQFEAGEHVHVDRGHLVIQRGPMASEGVDLKEIEANQFAATLLMPSQILMKEARSLGAALSERDISKLAGRFMVSDQAMTIRLTSIGLL